MLLTFINTIIRFPRTICFSSISSHISRTFGFRLQEVFVTSVELKKRFEKLRRGNMGRIFEVTLEGKIYSCKHCGTHLALSEDIVSKTFLCRHGKAYLFNKVANVTLGEKEERMMMTGLHIVADIFCVRCGSNVGWKYETAHEKLQKYKEGKSVLERFKICGPDGSNYYGAQFGGSDGDDA